MRTLALAVGALVIVLGITGAVSPDLVFGVVRGAVTPAGLWIAAAVRVLIGILFVRTAPLSRAPGFLRTLGVLIVMAGIGTPLFGVERSRSVMDAWAAWGPTFERLPFLVLIAAGAAIVYGFRRAPAPR